MLRIRLQRTGRKNRSFFRVVVAEHSDPVKGGYLALLGHYDPLVAKDGLQLDEAKVFEWIKKGAQPTDTVARLLKGAGVKGMESYIQEMPSRRKKNAPPEEEAPKAAPAPAAAAAPAVEAAPAEAPAAEEPAAEEPAAEAAPEAPATEETPQA